MIQLYSTQALLGILAFMLVACNAGDNKPTAENRILSTTTDSTIVDIEGNVYCTVKIGEQVWMKENLKVHHYRNGDPLPNIIDNTARIKNDTIGKCCFYNNDSAHTSAYGLLYNWYAVNDSRNICPTGWHAPSDSEWSVLSMAMGGPTRAGEALKEVGFVHWAHPNTDASNLSGFTALPGGHWDVKESFSRMGHYAYFWTCDSYDSLFAHECSLNFETSYFLQDWGSKQRGMSVRCIKDAE